MWPKSYRDYKTDTPLIKQQVRSGRDFCGCEMHDLNGWGETHHVPVKTRRGIFSTLLGGLFSLFQGKTKGR